MDKQHLCKICGRSFSCGRAVGGHMRAHLVFLPVPPKENQEDSSLLSPSSSSITHAANQDQNRHHQSNLLKPLVRRKRSRRPTPRIITFNSTREVEAAISLMKLSKDEYSKSWKEIEISRNGKEETDEKFTQKEGDNGDEDDAGGYKKTYIGNVASTSTSIATTLISNTCAKKCRDWIDLNLPPEEEDQDKDEHLTNGFK